MGKSLQPENALENWRQWNTGSDIRPVILGPLDGGRSNRSFLLESNGRKMVLRLNGVSALLPGASRESEFRIWQAAAKHGIAPPLLYTDPDAKYLVSTYIDNNLPAVPQADETLIAQALNLLSRCHQLEVDAPVIDYIDHIEQYWNVIEAKNHLSNSNLLKQREPMRSLLDSLINSDTPTGLCHHDPVTANFVGNKNRLYLIDWEYAARGLQVMDYAALVVEWGIDNTLITARTDTTPDLLSRAKSLYNYICTLWEEVTI
jgi:thiamine kinase-like enzyme